ncbi:pyruvate dehydrogenase (acetyl-transferring) E1 component subunit alpha [Thiohalorhabdus methylotrophus]|uniref:Pyruvate dehydrogenase E1 component subunit alpha n=1 Tax=Thiohalorhabdus methylotrophus TaxID=3242694 RepID=A0ABV4TTP8_9GAMM
MEAADRKRLLQEMVFARRFEERCAEAYHHRDIGGFLHLYPGQEACAFGVLEKARVGHDYVITGYRDHVHALKCGADPKEVMAELYGKETGSSRGRGGSMHIFDVQNHFMGGYALVGEPFPLAAGLAKGAKMKGSDQIAICFLGDGANNQGTFHETLNMAQLWELPVLFVCENNLYAIGTSLERSTPMHDQYKRAEAYAMEAAQVDGQDIDTVMDAAAKAVDFVRSGKGPYFLELMTYRLRGHSMSDSGRGYRSEEEIKRWMERDPIYLFRDRLVEEGVITADDFDRMDKEARDHVDDEVIPFAENSPEPDVKDLTKYVLSDDDSCAMGQIAGGGK